MSVLNPNSEDEAQECPLCMEYLELDDINFYPCSCGYQICRFCWNKIRTEGSGLCPACRSPYAENPADFKPLTVEELAKIKAEKRQKDQAKKLKISENRKHLANVRVVQRNLVFVVGLSPRLSDSEVLRKAEYFGKFGKIHKVVINHSTSYAGNQNQGPSASAYVTYYKSEDALRAIEAVNNIFIDGRTLKASLGTTKYCSHFMKNQTCPKHDCMYLHELGDEAASFTKEEMQQGKHTDYERSLHEEMVMHTAAAAVAAAATATVDPADRGDANRKENNVSRSPSPKQAWPNLLLNSFPESRTDSSNCLKESLDGDNIPRPVENMSPEESPENPADLNDLKHWSQPSSPDFLEEDDLGFDPFHETQKALAEMLESESKFLPIPRTESHGLVQQQHLPSQHFLHQTTATRVKAPPPGFNLTSNIHASLPHRYSDGLENLSSRMQHHQPLSQAAFPHHDFDLNNHLEKSGSATSWHGKDWQDGLRALLPNVNVSFGNLPSNYQQQQQHEMDLRSQHNVNRLHFSREEMDLNSRGGGWTGNDWTVLDPAIVGGQLGNNRASSPSHWITSNLEQLTSDFSSPKASSVLPGFSNLTVSSNPRQHSWVGQGNVTAAPPPGFAMARGGQIPHSFQNIASLNTNSDGHQIESKNNNV